MFDGYIPHAELVLDDTQALFFNEQKVGSQNVGSQNVGSDTTNLFFKL